MCCARIGPIDLCEKWPVKTTDEARPVFRSIRLTTLIHVVDRKAASAASVADESLVGFNETAARAEHAGCVRLHRFADAVRHEPSGFQGDAEGTVKLVRADALLAARDQVHCLKPKVHGDVRGFKDGADLHGEGLTALVALVSANAGRLALHLADALHTPAMRADRTVRPDARLDISVGGFFVVEVRCGKGAAHASYLRFCVGYVKYNNASTL